jgi:hypothetical protein
MTQFKKGDKVTLFRSWDDKGTVYAIQAIVHSCGKKRMILTSEETGEELGREFYPEYNEEHNTLHYGSYVTKRLEGDELTKTGEKLAQNYIDTQKKIYQQRIERDESERKYFERHIEDLHEPRLLIRDN